MKTLAKQVHMFFSGTTRRPWPPFLVALLIFAIAAVARLSFFAGLGTRAPFVTFFPAVMCAVLFGGLSAGFIVTVLSALLAVYCWIEPVGQPPSPLPLSRRLSGLHKFPPL
jgi:two-component system, cell cycle sensor histidine kinase and response regulator CckA